MTDKPTKAPPLAPDNRFREARFGAAVGNVNISSRGQSGGITAGEVHIHGDANFGASPPLPPPQPVPKSPWWKSWWAILSGIVVMLGGIVPTLEYLHIEWPRHHAPAAQVQQPPVTAQKPAAAPPAPVPVPTEQPPRTDTATMKQPSDPQNPPQGSPATQPTAQPQVNISSQNQSGGITAGTVNIYGQKQQRRLDQQGTNSLLQHVPKAAKVTVTAVMGDGEAFTYAQEITNWMRSNGWLNVDGVNQAVFSGPVFGQGIHPNTDGSFDIQIGNRR